MPDLVTDLHCQAAQSLSDHGFHFEAFEHAFAVADYDFIYRLIRRSHKFLMQTENRAAVSRLFARLPMEYLRTEPWLCVMDAWIVWAEGKLSQAEELLACAQKAYQRMHAEGRLPEGDPEYDGLPAEMLAFDALIHTQKENPDQVIALADRALAAAPQGSPVISATALLAQQVAYRQKGEMDKAIESCFKALPLTRAADDIGTRVSVLHSLGVGLMIQGKLDQVIQVYEEGLRFAETQGEIEHPRYDLIYFKLPTSPTCAMNWIGRRLCSSRGSNAARKISPCGRASTGRFCKSSSPWPEAIATARKNCRLKSKGYWRRCAARISRLKWPLM